MRILVDTQVLIWAVGFSSKLGRESKALLESRDHVILWSMVSAWETQIKTLLGKLSVPTTFWRKIRELDFELIELTLSDVEALELPFLYKLRDPFDSMLAAQAQLHGAIFMTSDQRIIESELIECLDATD